MGSVCSTFVWTLSSKARKRSASVTMHPRTPSDDVSSKPSPEMEQGFSYLGDVEQKLALIKQIGELYDGHLFADLKQGIFWSMLWASDVEFLQNMIRKLKDPDTKARNRFIEIELMYAAEAFPKLLHYFRGGRVADLNDPQGKISDAADSSGAQKSSKERRDPEVPKHAKQRDGNRCMLLGTADPQICHIFPFAARKHHKSVGTQLRLLKPFLDPGLWEDLIYQLGGPKDAVDSLPNVLSLNRQLHKYWVDGRFALEPLGAPTWEELPEHDPDYDNGRGEKEDPQGHETRASKKQKREPPPKRWCLKMRFRWMKQTGLRNAQEEMDFDTDPRDHWQDPGDIYDHYNVKTSRPVRDGHIVEVFADDKCDLPDWKILQLQWWLTTTWSLTAGADPVHYRFPDDDDFDYLGESSVSRTL